MARSSSPWWAWAVSRSRETPSGVDGGRKQPIRRPCSAAAATAASASRGPGMGTDDDSVELLAAVLATDLPVLVDADGLTILAEHRELLNRSAPTLITPHAGELSRLLGASAADIEARRLEHARRAASQLGVTVLLKGSTTVVADPDGGTVLANPTGTPWLATAGTGDVLSGLAGALLAQGLAPAQAAIAAAYLHGLAARLAGVKVPVLVLWGEADRIADPDYGRAFAAAIPGARFELLKATGHLPQIETPDQLLEAIWAFTDAP